ncbi:RhoGAP-domain-containing protein [Lichtheimia hyalospora FSU 10163]|nr:RhoGAP-domain-containing protein [Lichtheimia hyalospora FSU 10163]
MVKSKSAKQQDTTHDILKELIVLDQDGLDCLRDKVYLELQAVKDAMLFFERRAAIEQEYGKQMLQLSRSMDDVSQQQSGLVGGFFLSTYGNAWTLSLKVHEIIGEQRLHFADDVAHVASDLHLLIEDMEERNKQIEELGIKHDRQLADAKVLSQLNEKYGSQQKRQQQRKSNIHRIPRKELFKHKRLPIEKLDRMEESRAAISHRVGDGQLQTNSLKLENHRTHLPAMLMSLKDVNDECCAALRYQLARYAYAFEQAIALDGLALDDDHGMGLRSLAERIDKESDLFDFIQSYNNQSISRLRGSDIFKSKFTSTSLSTPVFGIDLKTLVARSRGVPIVLVRCARAVEEHGLHTVGIYRIPGISTQVQKLRTALNQDCAGYHLLENGCTPEQVNNVTSVLKLWFRELPDPLFPRSLYPYFIDAAKTEDEQSRVTNISMMVHELPDENYMTLEYLMRHLERVQQHQKHNKMDASNLATIFGMTLMGYEEASSNDLDHLQEAHYQMQVVQIILENYHVIFASDQ